MIKSISIRKFRIFENIDIQLGTQITVIAGRNATGKSNLLAMLGNSCQLTSKKYKTFFGKQFRTEFGEIFRGSKKFDIPDSGMYKVVFDEINEDKKNLYRDFRVTWQNNGTRFRVIPKYEWEINGEKKKTETKYEIPSMYIGLSRLFPIGESKDSDVVTSKIKQTEDEKDEMYKLYNSIMEPESITDIEFVEVSEKKGAGISTLEYDYNSNSAGQDNITQILLALLSFKRLEQQMGSDYHGGLLLIDEIESTLHPKAQVQLINTLDKFSKKYKIQIVVTSHSEIILKSIASKLGNQKIQNQNEYRVVYLTKGNGYLECKNDNISAMISDLNSISSIYNKEKLTVYSEDDEARWLLTKLTKHLSPSLNLVKIKMGHDNLLKLDFHDKSYFSNVLFVFDGDVEVEKLTRYHRATGNKILLPFKTNPEKVIYNYIKSLEKGHALLSILWDVYSLTKEMIIEDCKDIDDREQSKPWFLRHQNTFEEIEIVDHLRNDCPVEIKEFENIFINKYNGLATKLFISKISNKI